MSSVLLFLLSYTFLRNQKLNSFFEIQQAANSSRYTKHVLHLLPHHQGYVSSCKTHASSLCFGVALAMATALLTSIGEIPSFKLFESEKTLAFLDIGPLAKGHAVYKHYP